MTNLLISNFITQLPASPDFPLEIAKSGVSGILTLIGIVIAAYLAYRYALKQRRKETFIGLEKTKYERKLNALEECWKLLAFTTDTENTKSILTWEQLKGGNKTYLLNQTNAKDFMKCLTDFFYGSGLGIYLSKEIKAGLFEYRSILYGFLLKEKNNENDKIFIQNAEPAKRMTEIHQNLIIQVKNETGLIDKIEKNE